MSTGNDIVFLGATRPERTVLTRFYSRILSPAEQALYRQPAFPSLAFDHYIWLCWSVKEAVFKYRKRSLPGLVFSPLTIEVGQIESVGVEGSEKESVAVEAREIEPAAGGSAYRCVVNCGLETFYSRSFLQDGVIMTVVSEDETFADTCWGVRRIDSAAYADQSAAVRSFLLQELKARFFLADPQIEKDAAGCPDVWDGGHRLEIPVSLAHHDRYVAWSFRYSHSVL
jgi:phosphopantetheinyl transferase (holo-ACP synthase)